MRPVPVPAIFASVLCVVAGVATAQTPAATQPVAGAAVPGAACSSDDHRRFDFWAGEWVVHGGKDGKTLQGHNRIERSADGCRLLESWRGASGFSGQSLNAWDAAHRVWRQFWVGSDGVVLHLQGDVHEGAMVMTGELPTSQGGVQLQRITWTPAADGSVSQQWDVSDDDGAHWAVSFLGVYRRSAAP